MGPEQARATSKPTDPWLADGGG
eukprot:COSAG06_NODE_61500_length_267_cov_1.089286_2_plen_22_part_01